MLRKFWSKLQKNPTVLSQGLQQWASLVLSVMLSLLLIYQIFRHFNSINPATLLGLIAALFLSLLIFDLDKIKSFNLWGAKFEKEARQELNHLRRMRVDLSKFYVEEMVRSTVRAQNTLTYGGYEIESKNIHKKIKELKENLRTSLKNPDNTINEATINEVCKPYYLYQAIETVRSLIYEVLKLMPQRNGSENLECDICGRWNGDQDEEPSKDSGIPIYSNKITYAELKSRLSAYIESIIRDSKQEEASENVKKIRSIWSQKKAALEKLFKKIPS